MENLPIEIADNILSRLPMVLKIKSREVCKTWRTLVHKPKRGLLYEVLHRSTTKLEAEFYFSEQNTEKVDDEYLGELKKLEHSITLPSSSFLESFMVGSFHDLVCYASYYSLRSWERKIHLCNPVTGERIQLASIYSWDGRAIAERAIGFGYNHSSNEYKVVRIFLDVHSHREGSILVYNLQEGGNTWRKIRSSTNLIKCFEPGCVVPSVGVFAGGALHWMGSDNRNPATVASFDLEHETFEFLPSIPSVACDANVGLMVLGGNLLFLEVSLGKHVRIWELRNKKTDKYRETFRWRTKFRIAREEWSGLERLALTKSAGYLLWYNVVLSCYYPETKTLRKVEETLKKFLEDCQPSSIYTTNRATSFMHNLVSFKANTEEPVGKKKKSPG